MGKEIHSIYTKHWLLRKAQKKGQSTTNPKTEKWSDELENNFISLKKKGYSEDILRMIFRNKIKNFEQMRALYLE